jgi:LysR family transcriptional regulator, transcriptional activator of nhaA
LAKINFNHLYYFWVIAKEGHLGRAAQKLFVSQSALSTQLKKLEESLKKPLFIREGRVLKLTETGQMTLSYADKMFNLGNELSHLLRENIAADNTSVKIGIVSSLSRNFVENFIRPLLTRDDIELQIDSGNQDELLMRLNAHQLDLVLSNYRPNPSAQYPLKTKSIAKQQLSFVGKFLESNQSFTFPDDLLKYKLLLPSRSTEVRTRFDQICDENQINYRVMAEINDMPALRLLVRDSNCIALLPMVVVQDEVKNGVLQEYCKIPGLFEHFYAISLKRHYEPDVIKFLLNREPDEMLYN